MSEDLIEQIDNFVLALVYDFVEIADVAEEYGDLTGIISHEVSANLEVVESFNDKPWHEHGEHLVALVEILLEFGLG